MTSTPTRPVDNVVITTKGLQDRNNLILDGRTVENKGKLVLNEIFSSAQNMIFKIIDLLNCDIFFNVYVKFLVGVDSYKFYFIKCNC